MDKKVKEVWIEALLSDEYDQGPGNLCKEFPDGTTNWCCLGVLLDVADDEDWFVPDTVLEVSTNSDGSLKNSVNWRKSHKVQPVAQNFIPREEGSESQLSDSTRKLFGISDAQHEKLMEMNDSGKWSFRRIAGYIKRYM